MPYIADLDTPLLRLSARDRYALRDPCVRVRYMGAISRGKSACLARETSPQPGADKEPDRDVGRDR